MSTFILVHGAFHGEWIWHKVVPLLEKAGHRTLTLDLPGHGKDQTPPFLVSMEFYTNRVTQLLEQQSEPVFLVGHSMGGMVISQAAERFPEKIKAVVYLAAMLPRNGESLLQINENDKHALPLPVSISGDQSYLQLDVSKIKGHFYGECSEVDLSYAQERLCHQPLAPFITPVQLTEESFGRVPRIYIETLKDKAISIEFQRELHSRTLCHLVETLDSDHSPFFSKPEKLVSVLHNLSNQI